MLKGWPLVGRHGELDDLRRTLRSPEAPGGVAVFGDAGVGKTRLIRETAALLGQEGVAVEWVQATEAAREITLGSFAHLLGADDDAHQRDDLLHLALARLLRRAGDEDFVLAVDDAHLLDESSVALLHLAATQSQIRLLLTVRAGDPRAAAGLLRLWKDELLTRLDLDPLTRDAAEHLVFEVLGTETPASLVDRIWHLSRGNPLFVRELINAAVDHREIDRTRPRLRELVEDRLGLLDESQRSALQLVSVAEQVPVEAAQRLVSRNDLEALEEAGLLAVIELDGTAMIQVAHPLYREVLDAALPKLRRLTLLGELLEAVAGTEKFDRLRLARWQLESGHPGEPEQLVQLARDALGRFDHQLAERLARAAGGVERVDAGLILSEALVGQGRTSDAQTVMAALRPSTPEQLARVAIARASELFLHLDQSAEAFDILQRAIDDLAGNESWRSECLSVLSQMSWFAMRIDLAEEITEGLMSSAEVREPALVRAIPVAASLCSAKGRVEEAVKLLGEDICMSARRHRREVAFGELQLRMARFLALYWAGRVRELDEYAAADLGLELADDPTPSLAAILAGFRGGALLGRGRAQEALTELQRASRAFAESDWFGQRPLVEAMRARAAVFAGELAVADEALQAADTAFAADRLRGARTLPFIELSRAWFIAAKGATDDARQRCLALAVSMQEVAKPVAVEAVHAAARLDAGADTVDLIDQLAGRVEGVHVLLIRRHVMALWAGDASGLLAVGEQFEQIGADLIAAEAYRSAANAFRRRGRGAASAAAGRRAHERLARCGNPYSPALAPAESIGEPLTKREREVALLAAQGSTSADIAERLFLSVRTVDTHLSHVYRKLQIDGRHELAQALGTPHR